MDDIETELENSKLYEFTKYFARAALTKLNKLEGKPEVSKVYKIVGAFAGLGAAVATGLSGGPVSTVVEQGALKYCKIKQQNDKLELISTIYSTSSKHSLPDFLRCVIRLGVSVYDEYKNSIVYVNHQTSIVNVKNEGPKPDTAGSSSAAGVRKENKIQAMHALGQYAGEMVFGKMLELKTQSREKILSSLTCKPLMGKIRAKWDSLGIHKLFYWSQKPGREIKEKTLTPYNYFVEDVLDEPIKSNVAIRTREGDTKNLEFVHEQLGCGIYDLVSVADAIYKMIVRDPSFNWKMSITHAITDVGQDVKSVGAETHDNNTKLIELKEIAVDISAQVVSLVKNIHGVRPDPIWFPADAFQQQTVHGREKVVADLHKEIKSIKGKTRFVIFGIGGMGKTTVVRKYITDYHENYDHFIWIHAQNVHAAQNQFKLLAAKKLGIQPKTSQTSPENFLELLEKIYEKLCSNQGKVLLVLDNAEAVSSNDASNTYGVDSLSLLLPPSFPGSDITVLITSRESNWNDDVFHCIKLGHWNDEECIDFVLKKLKLPATVENKETAFALATHFDRLTISMQSAVSIIREEKDRQQHEGEVFHGIQDLINDYDTGRKGRLPEMQLWNISFRQILKRENGDLAIKIICFMAYLSPDEIPKKFLRALFQDTNDGRCLTDALLLLTRYSLIDHFDTHYTIHRRIQEAVVQNLKLESSGEQSLILTDATFENDIEVVKQLSQRLYAYLSQMTTKELLDEKNFDVIANCLHVTSHLSHDLYSFLECRKFAEAVADIMYNAGNYSRALELYKTVLDSTDSATDDDFKYALEIKDKIGGVLDKQGKLQDALEIFSKMLEEKLDVFGTHHPSTLETQGNVIEILVKLNRHDEASEMFNKFQKDIKEMTHLEHPSALNAKWSFASLLHKHLKDYGAALTLLHDVLQELSKSPKPDQKNILGVQNWIASTFVKLGRHDDAAELYVEIISMSIKEFGHTSNRTLQYTKNYAQALHEHGEPKKALKMLTDVLECEENLKESKYVNRRKSVTKRNMYESHIRLKEFDKAIKILEELVGFHSEELGPDHKLTLATMHDLAFALGQNGKYEDSVELYEKVLERRINTLGLCHTNTLITKNNIGWTHFRKGDFEKAHVIALEILSTRDQSVEGEHKFDYSTIEDLLTKLNNLASEKKQSGVSKRFRRIRTLLHKYFRDPDPPADDKKSCESARE